MTEATTRPAGTPTSADRVTPGTDQSGPYVTDWRIARALTRSLPRGVLSRPARELYHLIAGHVGASGAAFVSMKTLADEADLHEGTARKARAELERAGLILTVVGGGNRTNVYRLIDFRLSTPRAHQRGVTPRQPARDPAPTGAEPRAHRREEEGEEHLKERACACGNACPPGRWRCTECQSRVDTAGATIEVLLRYRNRPVE